MKLFCGLDQKTIIINDEQAKLVKETIAYHGSKSNFDKFSCAYIGTGIGAQEFGEGIYLSFDKEVALGYGSVVYTVDIPDVQTNNYIFYDQPIDKDCFEKIIEGVINYVQYDDPEYYNDETNLNDFRNELYEVLNPSEGRYLMYNIHKYVDDKVAIPNILNNAGVIGFIYNNGKVDNVVMFSSKNIKIIDKENIDLNESQTKIFKDLEETVPVYNRVTNETKNVSVKRLRLENRYLGKVDLSVIPESKKGTLDEVIFKINTCICEAYGISQGIRRIGYAFLEKIMEKRKSGDYTVKERGNGYETRVYNTSLSLPNKEEDFGDYYLYDKTPEGKKKVNVNITFIEYYFKSQDAYRRFVKENGDDMDSWSTFDSNKYMSLGFLTVAYPSIKGYVQGQFYSNLEHEITHFYQQNRLDKRYPNAAKITVINNNMLNNENEIVKKVSRILYLCDDAEQEAMKHGMYAYIMKSMDENDIDPRNVDELAKNDTAFKYLTELETLVQWLKNNKYDVEQVKSKLKENYGMRSVNQLIRYAEYKLERFYRLFGRTIKKIKKDKGMLESVDAIITPMFALMEYGYDKSPKLLINEEENLLYLTENDIINKINSCINEEYGISRLVIKICDRIKDEILNNKHNISVQQITKGVNCRKFNLNVKLPSEDNLIGDEFKNNENLKDKTISIHLNVTNFNFANQEVYDKYINDNGDLDFTATTGFNGLGNKNVAVINLTYRSISGKPLQSFYSDLQHEISHVYQQLSMGKRYDNSKKMLKYNTNITNENDVVKIFSKLLYLCDNAEQDSAINGLYGYLINSKERDFETIDKIIKNDTAFKWLTELENGLDFIKNHNLEDSKKLLSQKLDIQDVDKTVKYIEKQLKRFYNKISRCIIKAKQDIGITENVLYETNSNLLCLLPLTEEEYFKPEELLTESYWHNDFDIENVEQVNFKKEFNEPDEDDTSDEGYWEYGITCYDNEGNICYDDWVSYEDLEELLGEDNAQYIANNEKDYGTFHIEQDTSVSNLDDVNEVNAKAKKLFQVTEYYPGSRGYILTDGSFIYFGPNVDHISITRIDGMTVGKFVSLGNIRVGVDSFELEKIPTIAQKRQLYELIANSEEVYVDICKYSGKGQYSHSLDGAKFVGAEPQIVLNQINRFITDGIKMQPNNFYEATKQDLHKLITETVKDVLFEHLLLEANLDDIYTKYYSNIPQEDFWSIIKTDPTWNEQSPQKMGKYGKWLLNQYKQGKMKMEDLYKYRESLEAFHKYNKQLNKKDIMAYGDGNSLYDAVKPFIDNPDQATSKSDEIRRIKQQAEKVYEDNEWLILIPKTEEAAKYYGKGTRWCTAAENNNFFNNYNNQGPLYININKQNGNKYQFHFESEQFMYDDDSPIEGVIADTIELSDGAKKYYESIGRGYEINENYNEDPYAEPEEETIFEDDEWLVTQYPDGDIVYIASKTNNERYEIDIYDGELKDENNQIINTPWYKIFTSGVLGTISDQLNTEDFYKGLLGLSDEYTNVFKFYSGSKVLIVVPSQINDFYNGIIYDFDENHTPQIVIDFSKYGLFFNKEDEQQLNKSLHRIILRNPQDNKENVYLSDENRFVFKENVDTYCGTRSGVGQFAINNNQGVIVDSKGNTIIIPPMQDNLNFYGIHGIGKLVLCGFNEMGKQFVVYSLDKKQYVITNPCQSYSLIESEVKDSFNRNIIGLLIKDKDERHIDMWDYREIKDKYGYASEYYPDSNLPVILNDGTVMTRTQYWKSQGLFEQLMELW